VGGVTYPKGLGRKRGKYRGCKKKAVHKIKHRNYPSQSKGRKKKKNNPLKTPKKKNERGGGKGKDEVYWLHGVWGRVIIYGVSGKDEC